MKANLASVSGAISQRFVSIVTHHPQICFNPFLQINAFWNIFINVFTAAPSYIRILPVCVVVNEGESFTLTCEADGDPAPTFNWYKNDVMIHQGAVLYISNANWTIHDGLTVCKATNSKGSRQTWEGVHVQCELRFIYL